MNTIRQNIFKKLCDTYATQADFADALGVTAAYVNHLYTGYRPITEKTVLKIIRKLNLPQNYFDRSDLAESETALELELSENTVPLLSWVRAGEFCEAPAQFTSQDAEELLPKPLFNTSNNTFALTVRGDSMDTPDGYREGEIVYIDPEVSPTPGRDVLARTSKGMTLKRYKEDEQGPYLLQLNGNIIIRPTEDWHVCGVVVFAGRKR